METFIEESFLTKYGQADPTSRLESSPFIKNFWRGMMDDKDGRIKGKRSQAYRAMEHLNKI